LQKTAGMFDPAWPFAAFRPPGPEPMNVLASKRVRQAVLGGEPVPGCIVAENDLAERYRLGRARVRVALIRLASTELVEARARHGWLITPVAGQFVGELVAARRCLEMALADIRLRPKESERLNALAATNAALHSQGGTALVTAQINDRQILDLLAQRLDRLRARWLAEAWDHSERIVALLATEDSPWWPYDWAGLRSALLQGDSIAARQEIEADIGNFESYATRALLRLPMPLLAHSHRNPPCRSHSRVLRRSHVSSPAANRKVTS
jgi:DNA-binding GntR family transcriptional regulator